MKKIALVKCRNSVWKAFNNELRKRNIEPTLLDVFKSNDLNLLLTNDWDGVIWTAKHTPKIKNLAKRILTLYDLNKNTKVYPDLNCYWHYDDKIAQYFLLRQIEAPIPKTYLFYDMEEALNCLSTIEFPLVFKSADGAGSSNVRIVDSLGEAKKITKRLFRKGVKTFFKSKRQKGYLLFQEFQKNNPGDYRLVVYGNEVMGHFRPNRKETPLASGSDIYVYKDMPHDLLTIVHNLSQKLNSEVMSFDAIRGNNGGWVIAEISVIYGNYGYEHYEKSKVYSVDQEGIWKEIEKPGPHYERVASYVLDKWNLDE